MTKLLAALGVAIVFCCGLMIGAGANKFATPSTILHVITIKWKAEATPEQRKAAIDGIKTMAGQVPGIKAVWLKSIKVQPRDYNAAVVMEFENQKSFDDYAKNPAHDEWKKLYDPAHEESTTHDITN